VPDNPAAVAEGTTVNELSRVERMGRQVSSIGTGGGPMAGVSGSAGLDQNTGHEMRCLESVDLQGTRPGQSGRAKPNWEVGVGPFISPRRTIPLALWQKASGDSKRMDGIENF